MPKRDSADRPEAAARAPSRQARVSVVSRAIASLAIPASAAGGTAAAVLLTAGGGGPLAEPDLASAAIIRHVRAELTALRPRRTPGRGIKGPLGHPEGFSDTGTAAFEYDPATNTIYEYPDASSPPPFTDPVAQVPQELVRAQAQVDGTVAIDGTSLYKIDRPRGLVGYFDTRNYAPRYVDDPQRDGTVVRLRVVVYGYLPMTSANRDLLSVTEQHPGARVDTNPSDSPAPGK